MSCLAALLIAATSDAAWIAAPLPRSSPLRLGCRSALTMGTTSDFKVGLTIEFENSVWRVQDFLHVKPGKGPAFVRSTLKNLQNGKTLEKTWRAGESFPDATVVSSVLCISATCVQHVVAAARYAAAQDTRDMQFSYIDESEHVFIDLETFEEARIKTAAITAPDFIRVEQ